VESDEFSGDDEDDPSAEEEDEEAPDWDELEEQSRNGMSALLLK
jgi:hypothetical protein